MLGRFFSVSRTWEAFLAGINHMGWVNFLLFTVVGGGLGNGYRAGSLLPGRLVASTDKTAGH